MTDPTTIVASAQHLLETAATVGAVVLLSGLAVAGLWGWLTRGRGY